MAFIRNLFRKILSSLRRSEVALALGIVLCQAYFFQWHAGYPNPNEVIRIYLTRAIVEEGTFKVDGQIRKFGNVEDKSRRGGHIYCDKAPGLSLLAVPVYGLASLMSKPWTKGLGMKAARHFIWVGLLLIPSFFFLILLYRFFRETLPDPLLGRLLITGYGLGTLAFTFSGLVFSHQLAAMLLFTAFIQIERVRRGEGGMPALIFAGLCAGFAIITEYPTAFAAFFLAVYGLAVIPRRLRTLAAVGAALLPLGLALFYNWSCFGGPFKTGYSFLDKAYFAGIHAKGLMGITSPKWPAFAGSFLDASRGLFYFSPFLALALPGLALMFIRKGSRLLGATVLAIILWFAFFISSFGYWQAGGSVGQRHLTALVPFMLIPIAAFLNWIPRKRGWPLLFTASFLFALSVMVTVLASIPWPYPSPRYSNILSQIAIPFWRDGLLPPHMGEGFGLSIPASTAPFFILLGLLAAAAFAGLGTWRSHWERKLLHLSGIAIALPLGLALWMLVSPLPQRAAEHFRDQTGIARLVDPQNRRPLSREYKALMKQWQSNRRNSSIARRLGEIHAQRGQGERALHWYRQAGLAPAGSQKPREKR